MITLTFLIAFIASQIYLQIERYKKIPYSHEIISIASRYMIPASLAIAQVQQESSFRPNAIGDNGASRGLMQVQRSALTDVNNTLGTSYTFDDLFIVEINLHVGFAYLELKQQQYGNYFDALRAYNDGTPNTEKGKRYAETVFKLSKQYS